MRGLALVHLVWAPLPLARLERFVTGYRQHAAGVEHRLVVIMKDFADPRDAAPHDALVRDVADQTLFYDAGGRDLSAYRWAASRLDAEHLCFLNSESVPLAHGWLAALTEALVAPGVGAVGATGSYEAPRSRLPHRRRRWPAFPNPHLRTNGFALARDVMLGLRWPDAGRKAQAWELESGRRGMTRQLWSHGLHTLVVGRDGRPYGPEDWPASATFRSGDQQNLLIADNRTREWQIA